MSGPFTDGEDMSLVPSLGSRMEPDLVAQPLVRKPGGFLTPAEIRVICRGLCLLGLLGDTLAEHEGELLLNVGRRYLDFGGQARVTRAEWQVIEDAIEAMVRRMPAELARQGWPFSDEAQSGGVRS